MEEDYYIEEEEFEEEKEEKQNRTFIILVAVLGGLLALGICAFVVWAVVGNRWIQDFTQGQNASIQSTNEAVAIALDETATAEAQPTATHTLVPTDTPAPTSTPTPTTMPPSPTPSRAPATVRPTITRRPTATATAETTSPRPPDTGIGALGASAMAVGLLFVLIVVRRLRKTV